MGADWEQMGVEADLVGIGSGLECRSKWITDWELINVWKQIGRGLGCWASKVPEFRRGGSNAEKGFLTSLRFC